jgi:3-(3-hydroxy-phenyl)propionate hydroxylase/flavoprotein hydroxylase
VSIISLGPTHHRFSFMLNSAADFYTEGRPELVWERVAAYLAPDDAELIRVATYSFSSLIALDWRVGRTVLAGDAAHQMPPFLGQGMCAGIRDAQNLAFKLDLILRGRRGDDLLDSYQMEREPHVRAVTEKAIELGRLQTIRDPEAAAARDGRLLAGRAAGTAPEKMQFPGLASGLLSRTPTSGRGELFVQGDVDGGGGVCRFDEVVGRGFVTVATEAAYQALAASGSVARLEAAGVLVVGITEHRAGVEDRFAGPDRVLDAQGVYRRWFEDHRAVVTITRPDFYVFGTADGIDEAEALIDEFLGDISPTRLAPAQQPAHQVAV